MPELMVIPITGCESYWGWSIKIPSKTHPSETHLVEYHYQSGWFCDCKGFYFRKNCSHVIQAKGQYCGWINGYTSHKSFPRMEDFTKNPEICPVCGSPATVINMGV